MRVLLFVILLIGCAPSKELDIRSMNRDIVVAPGNSVSWFPISNKECTVNYNPVRTVNCEVELNGSFIRISPIAEGDFKVDLVGCCGKDCDDFSFTGISR